MRIDVVGPGEQAGPEDVDVDIDIEMRSRLRTWLMNLNAESEIFAFPLPWRSNLSTRVWEGFPSGLT